MKYCYNDYEKSPQVANQQVLLTVLRERGLEKDNDGILMTKGAVPVTALLFCLKEAKEEIILKLSEIPSSQETPIRVSYSELPSDVQSAFNSQIPSYQKSYQPIVHPLFGGSSGFQEAQWCSVYTAFDSQPQFVESELPAGIYRVDKMIVKPDQPQKPVELYQIAKGFFKFVEFCYALSERVKSEIQVIAQKRSTNIQSYHEFNGACTMRGGIMHSNNSGVAKGIPLLDFSSQGNLMVGKKTVSDFVDKAYDQAFQWVDSEYQELIDFLNGQIT